MTRYAPPPGSLFASLSPPTDGTGRTDAPFPGLSRADHGPTSKAAADAITGASGSLRRKVWDFLLERWDKGATDEEMQDCLAMPASTQRPRRVELVTAGEIVNSGRTRPTRSGRAAVVWVMRGVQR